jgi:hypothetical protein
MPNKDLLWEYSGTAASRVLLTTCLLTILAAESLGGKTALKEEWERMVESQRETLTRFELVTETYRFEILETTESAGFAQGEEFLKSAASLLSEATPGGLASKELLTALFERSHLVFGTDSEVSEVAPELLQRDGDLGFYRVWNQRSGSLSMFDGQGSWRQGEGEISLGPPIGLGEIELYLARLGLMVPSFAAIDEVPNSTPTSQGKHQVYVADLEGARFRVGCQPWLSGGAVSFIEEFPYWEGKEQGIWEKRKWFSVPSSATISGVTTVSFFRPVIGITLRYDSAGSVNEYAITRVIDLRLDPAEWRSFPRERPPFGWTVLDYRFTPELEYRFGTYER